MKRIVSTSRTGGRSRRAYTLLELLLVLGILLVLAGIAWPGIQSIYGRHRLQSAVEDVRGHLAATRLRAIDTGLVYQFVYEPGGRRYHVLPFEADDGTSAAPLPTLSGELAEPMRFETPDGQGSVAVPAALIGQSTTAPVAGAAWAAPILFAPDGTATGASLDVVDGENQFVRLSVRNLTAAVSADTVRQRSAQ